MNAGAIVVMTTAGSREEAGRIAEALLNDELAACVQLTDIESRYVWKGEVAREAEVLMLIKTRSALYDAVEAAIREAHSYETPEVLALTVDAGSPAYLAWLGEVTRDGSDG